MRVKIVAVDATDEEIEVIQGPFNQGVVFEDRQGVSCLVDIAGRAVIATKGPNRDTWSLIRGAARDDHNGQGVKQGQRFSKIFVQAA